VATAGPGGFQPGGGAFADEVAFELGQSSEHMEHKLAAGVGEHPVAAGGGEGVDLKLWLLVGGGDAGMAEQMTDARHRRRTL
jgi:hypothetical protein